MRKRIRKRRHMGVLKKKKKTVFAPALAAALCVCILFGSLTRRDSLLDLALRQAKNEAYLLMLKNASPSLFYEKQEKSGVERLLDLVFRAVPVYGYVSGQNEYATQSESEISYETIIAREAADENYVDDATGEVVTSDGQEDAGQEDVPDPAAKEKEAGEQKAENQPAEFARKN